MKTFLWIASVLALSISTVAQAEQAEFIVSINKTVKPSQIEQAVEALNHIDPSMGTCYVNSQVSEYIKYDSCTYDESCPYWGVAIVQAEWSCDSAVKEWLARIGSNRNYTIYANGPVDPMPVVSGGNTTF